jgi:hypothetical protein
MRNELAKQLIDEAVIEAPQEIPMMMGISVAMGDLETPLYLMNEIAPKMTEAIQNEMKEHALIAAGALLRTIFATETVPEGEPLH